MKYTFKIRFNTSYQQHANRYWKVLSNEEEHLVSEVIIKQKEVLTIRHTLSSSEENGIFTAKAIFIK